jgi:hypothetical protein
MPLKVYVLKLMRSLFRAMAATIKPELKIDLDFGVPSKLFFAGMCSAHYKLGY